MSRRVVAVLLLSLLPTHPAVGAHTLAAGVDGPDPDGAYLLSFDVHRDAAGLAHLALDVARTDADGTLSATRDLGDADLPAGTSRRNVTFLPAEGAGRYVVAIVVNGTRGAELAFDVSDDAASTSVTFAVADEPTYVNLTNDSVNAHGKVKSPGEALLTRGSVSDANGLADLDALQWNVERAGATVLVGTIAMPTGVATSSFEHRFDASPFEAGNYTLRIAALKGGGSVASAARTFTIREVAPTFVSGSLANVTPDENVTQSVTVVLADKNGIPVTPDVRVYRGSTRVESPSFDATLGEPARLADADGAARIAYPLTLRVPALASTGAYRVSLYHEAALIATIPFDVLALPTLANVNATSDAGRLVLRATGSGNGLLVARLTDGQGATTTVAQSFVNGSGAVTLDPPRRGVPLAWNVTLHARAGGPALAWREGNWSAPADGPAIALEPLHVRARLPAAWRVQTPWPLEGANVSVEFTRWDGQAEPRLAGSLQGDRVRVQAPPNVPAGRYTARALVTWPNGTASETTWSFDAGPWVELTLGEPSVVGRIATMSVRNDGGLGISRLVVETQPRASVTLQRAGEAIPALASGGRTAFFVGLAPGEEATLRVELPSDERRSGAHRVDVRVLARVDVG